MERRTQLLPIIIFKGALIALLTLTPHPSHATLLESTFMFREALMPPGIPSVALRDDETAIIWNPAGLAMSSTYYFAYSWKGTYRGDSRKLSAHFVATKAKFFSVGAMRHYYGPDKETTTFISLAPRFTRNFSLGITAKRNDGFNFDCGAMLRIGRKISVGVVGRDLRNRDNARRYWETGIGLYAVPKRLILFFDVIDEDSKWRKATAYGGGFNAKLEHGMALNFAYFTDGSGDSVLRASLSLVGPTQHWEGEYTRATDEWETLSVRIATRSSQPRR